MSNTSAASSPQARGTEALGVGSGTNRAAHVLTGALLHPRALPWHKALCWPLTSRPVQKLQQKLNWEPRQSARGRPRPTTSRPEGGAPSAAGLLRAPLTAVCEPRRRPDTSASSTGGAHLALAASHQRHFLLSSPQPWSAPSTLLSPLLRLAPGNLNPLFRAKHNAVPAEPSLAWALPAGAAQSGRPQAAMLTGLSLRRLVEGGAQEGPRGTSAAGHWPEASGLRR